MRAFIDSEQLWIADGPVSVATRIPRHAARGLAREIRRIVSRHPMEKRWSWAGGRVFSIFCTKENPSPLLTINDRYELEPTSQELDQFIQTLETYGRTR